MDVTGRELRRWSLASHGPTTIEWDGRQTNGLLLPAGVYFGLLEAESLRERFRVMVIR